MRRQIRGLTQASANAQDGISFVQVAEGALNEVHDMLQRMNELSVKASNDTLTTTDREYIQSEVNALTDEISHATTNAKFNEIPCFPADGYSPLVSADDILAANNIEFEVEHEYISADGTKHYNSVDNTVGGTAVNYTGEYKQIADYVVEQAKNSVAALAQAYPTLFSEAASSGVKVGLKLTTIDGQSGVLASASMSIGRTADSAKIAYTMNVDTDDYNINNYKDGGLAATIAHEMTHLIMDDTMTEGMTDLNKFPKWFKEGMAQTSSGDQGWVSNYLNENSDAYDFAAYVSNPQVRDYGAGYLASMYLGYLAATDDMNGDPTVTSDLIKSGIDKIFDHLKGGKDISTLFGDNGVIGKNPNHIYRTLDDFTTEFFSSSPTDGSHRNSFLMGLLKATGSNGGGSLLAPSLSTPTADIFKNASGSYGSYDIDPTHISVTNEYGSLADGVPLNDTGLSGTPGHEGNGATLFLQVGSESNDQIGMKRYRMSAESLFAGYMMSNRAASKGNTVSVTNNANGAPAAGSVTDAAATGTTILNVSTSEEARKAIDAIKGAIESTSHVRSYYGAFQNRLEHTIKNLDNVVENTTSAESQIRDTDMAKEMVQFSNNNILAQAGQSMLASANQSNQAVLSLLS